MSENEKTTLQNILSAAKAEFLEKGFRGASLRNIVKDVYKRQPMGVGAKAACGIEI